MYGSPVNGHSRCVDVDDPDTWPEDLANLVRAIAADAQSENSDVAEVACSDLGVSGFEQDVRRMLDGKLLRAYHATRLLPHEVAAIASDGLRILNDDLVLRRLDAAYRAGCLTEAERRQLMNGRTTASGRRDKVCLFLSRRSITYQAHGLYTLMSTWGGEGIYWAHLDHDNALGAKLRTLGVPTIVVTQLDLATPSNIHVFPGLAHAFTGTALDLPDVGGSIHYFSPVPATNIETIIQPGDPDYPLHEDIPQN